MYYKVLSHTANETIYFSIFFSALIENFRAFIEGASKTATI